MRRHGVDQGQASGAPGQGARRKGGRLALWAAALIAASVAGGGPPAEAAVHVVQKGETLSEIAKAYGTTVEALIALNGIADPDRIQAGERLLVSAGHLVHVVAKGETLWDIAKLYDATPEQLASWNGISDPRRLMPGQELIVAARPTTHRVRAGETISAIAKRYGVTVESLAAVNNLANPNRIVVGQELLIPPTGGGAPGASVRMGAAGPWSRFSRWPVSGTVSSGFGMRNGSQHQGIDIAAPHGSPVRAVAAGKVVYADWAGSYGLLVTIDHGGGIETRYAHASRIDVKPGDQVAAGQVIARVGSTGRSTGPHLHFEVRVNGEPVDPLRWLP